METPTKMPTIAILDDLPSHMPSLFQLDDFAILVLMCSTLSLTVRDTFQSQNSSNIPPWDCRSNFAHIGSMMMTFESIHTPGCDDLGTYISDRFGTYEGFDRQRVGHFIWARAVYHLCGCLLYHPANIRRHRKTQAHFFPAIFARELLDRCREHAVQLTNILEILRAVGCCARGSFLGYAATCATSVHLIYAHSLTPHVATQAKLCSDMCLSFLEHLPIRWPNHNMMAVSLKTFNIDEQSARVLVDPSPTALQVEIDQAQIEQVWDIIDYAWLTDQARQSQVALSPFPSGLGAQFNDWTTFLDNPMMENDEPSIYTSQADTMREK